MSEVIYAYTRAQALEDGVLVDVTAQAKEADITVPTAMTAAVWVKCVEVPTACPWQDEAGRLWDVLWTLRHAIGLMKRESELRYVVSVQNDDRGPKEVKLKAVCGPGDDGEPVITIMLPEED